MKNGFLIIGALLLVTVFFVFLGLSMDYGKPAAQFLEEDVAELGKKYLRKKITIKGIVTRVDVSSPKDVSVYLGHGIECRFNEFLGAAKEYSIGETVFVDGILKKCEQGEILLDPAFGRDSKAPFNPKK